jgi:hypothetical protein
VALLPLAAAHLAYLLSIVEGHVPACVPYWDGCTSISRAARHGSGNLLFKLLMLPCALLQARLWWLVGSTTDSRRLIRALGFVAAFALACYVSFLGVEAEYTRALRRYGALLYFACTFLAQIILVRACWQQAPVRPPALRLMLAACVLLLLLGLGSTAVTILTTDQALKDRLENAIEWQLGALFTVWFLALAWFWRTGSTADFRRAG